MASRKPSGSKSKFKNAKPSRATAAAPQPPAALRPQGAPTTPVPKPPLAGGHAPKAQRADTAQEGADPSAPLKKQELIAQVVERSEVPKKHAKPVVEAMLAVLGEALGEGRELNLKPMGKVKRKRLKDTGKARVIVANIRQPHEAAAGADAPGRPAPGGGLTTPVEKPRKAAKEPVADDVE